MSSWPQSASAIADDPIGPIGADRELALIHMPARLREAFRALFAIDSAMGDVVARSTEPALARIKLAWWREQLEALGMEPPPAEPRLRAVAEQLVPSGVNLAEVAQLEPGWATLLDPEIDQELVASRGAVLFEIGGRLLGSRDPKLKEAGALHALAAVARRNVPELFGPAGKHLEALRGHRFDKRVRPLTMLARAAARDLDRDEPEGGKARVLAMLAHRWSGRIG
ncbi:MAG TPA: squalene/phytoene synthase family protein [Sphingomicrobium sp.]|nr:squalene/phytoene synthase family protein [Sphingomicrobium sp.]